MITNISKFKLNVKPVFVLFVHKYYYEGPCRMAGGEAIQPGFDDIANQALFNASMEQLKANIPDCVNLMEPVLVEMTDDWTIEDACFEMLFEDRENVDAYFATTVFGADALFNEFVIRCKKPVILTPNLWVPVRDGALQTYGAELIYDLDWEGLRKRIVALHARIAMSKSKLLLVPRFNYDLPVAGATDSFKNLKDVTELMGVQFRTVNAHEIVDEMFPLTEEGNHTTPGRKTINITEEEIAELSKMADELIAGADETEIAKEELVNSLRAWKVIQKNMDLHECSGAVIPCPDICSTRRMNKEHFTFCLTHSLNLEQGIPSACEYDVASAVTMLAEIAVSGKAPYMGNTLPLVFEDDKSMKRALSFMIREDVSEGLEGMKNLYAVQHSTPHRKFKGINEPDGSYAIRHFAYDQGFGAVMRHNFDEDKGQVITLAKFTNDLKQMMICKGTIVKSFGYEMNNCNGGFIFQVDDVHEVYKQQCRSGLHIPLIYGDYTQELKLLAESFGMEAVMV